ncbi:MAG: tetratricopeptide repeat protein, partial [Nodosilinea sp.]
MDEQRLPAYIELIQQLLQYPQEEVARLLQAHSHLVDEELVATLTQMATFLESQGNGDAAQRLRLAAQVAEALGLQQATPQAAEAARQFFLETLQLIVDQQGNPQQIYPLWGQQQSRFNSELLAELPSLAAQLLQENGEQRTLIASVLKVFGDLIQEFPLGLRWLNLELAIAAYTASLEVRTRENLPVDWAAAQMNLASAFQKRIRGDRAQNIEDAIDTYQAVLQVFTKDARSVDWATTQMNLASAFQKRIRGDRAQNIEDAIDAYQAVLQVFTRNTMPVDWAQAMNNLANAYLSRIRGDRAQNIEEAIVAYQQALQVR